MVDVLAQSVGSARLAFHPLPVLSVPVVGSVNDDVFVDGLGDGFLDLPTDGIVWKGVVRVRDILVGDQAAFVGDGFENASSVCDRGFRIRSPMILTQFLNEQRAEIKVLQMLLDLISVEGRRHVEMRGSLGGCLQLPHVRQCGHLPVQRQDFQTHAGIVVSDEAVEQSRAAGLREGLHDGLSVQWGDQPTAQGTQECDRGVGLGYAVVVLGGDICLPDDLIRGKDFRTAID